MDDDLLQDFLTEARDLLEDVDQKLLELEHRQQDSELINSIFRGFHTIKGGAGFLNATSLVDLCHRTETLFDGLRRKTIVLDTAMMDVIMAATSEIRRMFNELESGGSPGSASEELLRQLSEPMDKLAEDSAVNLAPRLEPIPATITLPISIGTPRSLADGTTELVLTAQGEPRWRDMLDHLQGRVVIRHGNEFGARPSAYTDSVTMNQELAQATDPAVAASQRQIADAAGMAALAKLQRLGVGGNAQAAVQPAKSSGSERIAPVVDRTRAHARESTIRVDTQRFDQILNLSGEIGLTKNRLNCLRSAFFGNSQDGKNGSLHDERLEETRQKLDATLAELDTLVGDLQAAVMKARMQPVGRVFQKYGRLARDVARGLGKDVELVILGAETEVDKTILEELNDPLVHLIRNAVDHGIESPVERIAAGKPARGLVQLQARQSGDHIVIDVCDDGRGMDPDRIRSKAIEKKVISAEEAYMLNSRDALNLIFLPGFSTKDQISDVSGRGVGMDVVQTNITKLKGRIEITSDLQAGSRFTISLPLTLAILPVLMMRCCDQIYSVPLSSVREIIALDRQFVQSVHDRPTLSLRGEVLPILDLADLLGQGRSFKPSIGIVASVRGRPMILLVDALVGQDEVMIKPLDGIKPKGVSGATLSGEGVLVLVLDLHELLHGHF